ncbi:MAG: UGSC family (seleno)protein, partial [Pseudomonadota bacterium]
ASAAAEAVGVPSSTLVCESFMGLAKAASVGLGMPNLQVAPVPGHPGLQSKDVLQRNVREVTLAGVMDNLLKLPAHVTTGEEPGARDIVCRGTFEEVNDYFIDHELSDGLPIVPPTVEKVEAFLRYTDRQADEVLGVLLPDSRAASVWSVAVNGVMAGCRPEYMPVLVALIEAMADPEYGVEHSGNTPGGETLIVLNGPIIKKLRFNYTQGAMRDGFQANTTVGRFWRLYLRNVAGFLPHKNDKATFGNTWRVVVAENEDVLAKIDWPPHCADFGFPAGTNAVAIGRYTGGNHISSVSGTTPESLLPYIADAVVKQYSWQIMFSVGPRKSMLRPMILLSPILAETIATGGWSKQELKQRLFDSARMPAWVVERQLRDWTQKPVWNLAEEHKAGHVPDAFHESDDPNRMVPIVWKPEDYMIVVTGDLGRNSCFVFAHNGVFGYPVGKEIKLPDGWTSPLWKDH